MMIYIVSYKYNRYIEHIFFNTVNMSFYCVNLYEYLITFKKYNTKIGYSNYTTAFSYNLPKKLIIVDGEKHEYDLMNKLVLKKLTLEL